MKAKVLGVIITICLILGMVACGKEDVKKESNNEPVIEDSIENNDTEVKQEENQKDENTEKIPENQNLLTGLADLSKEAIGKRPVAVMVNNINDALPQYGIADADIIFEMLVEGDLTRLMALYADYTEVPKVCAVRSCRYYYPVIAHGFDAFYVNWGFDETMRGYVDSIGVTYFDGMENPGNMFGRDQNRLNSGYGLEHTAYFDGTKFASFIDNSKYRTDLAEEKKGTAFLFNGIEEQVKPNGDSCTEVNIDFGSATAKLTYNEETNTYLKQINGKNQMDSVAGKQLEFTNVFVLETKISVRDTGYGHKQIDWKGGTNSVGYYVSNGAVQEISWAKSSEGDYLKFYDKNGEELTVNRGKSYIAFNYADQATFE